MPAPFGTARTRITRTCEEREAWRRGGPYLLDEVRDHAVIGASTPERACTWKTTHASSLSADLVTSAIAPLAVSHVETIGQNNPGRHRGSRSSVAGGSKLERYRGERWRPGF